MPRLLRAVLALGAAATLLPALAVPALAGPVTSPTAPVITRAEAGRAAAPTPGGAGIGDPYYPTYGNGGYDVSSYDILVTYRPKSDRLEGVTTIKARTTKALSRFHLDLVLKASSVTVDGRRAAFTQRDRHELVVTPRRPLRAGATMSVVVRYAGVPSKTTVKNGSNATFTPWTRGNGGAVAVGEPEIAAWWFPSNDHPRDKALFAVTVRVPKGLEAISNGALVSHRTKGAWTTWAWRSYKPMATYLAFFAAGQYTITRGTAAGRPYLNAVPATKSALTRQAAADLRRTPEVVNWLSSRFGAYPFGQVGGVVTSAPLGYALETQTRPVYDQEFFRGGSNVSVIVHENAHQWFGDSVSVRNWRDIWLNEGFATYAEWWWAEQHRGPSAHTMLGVLYRDLPGEFWSLRIGDPGRGNEFASPVYDRGAMTLQALRQRVGDRAFGTILRTWVAQRRYGNADIAAFVALAERVSGQELDGFLTAWLYTGRRPAATAANGIADLAGTRSAADPVTDLAAARRLLDQQRANRRGEFTRHQGTR